MRPNESVNLNLVRHLIFIYLFIRGGICVSYVFGSESIVCELRLSGLCFILQIDDLLLIAILFEINES